MNFTVTQAVLILAAAIVSGALAGWFSARAPAQAAEAWTDADEEWYRIACAIESGETK